MATFTDQEALELAKKLSRAIESNAPAGDRTKPGYYTELDNTEIDNYIEFAMIHFGEDAQVVAAVRVALVDFQIPIYIPNSRVWSEFHNRYKHYILADAGVELSE